jgi:hypothetical protein
VKGEILMEHEITDTGTKSAKPTLTKIVKFNIAISAAFAGMWALGSLFHQPTSQWSGLFGFGFLLGLLVTIAALNVRLRVELEEPDLAE